MRWKHTKRPDIYEEYLPWFAWYPVVIKDKWHWLETVYRMREVNRFSFEGFWLYRTEPWSH